MKHFFTLTVIAALATASVITLSAFNSKKSTTATEYQITCASKTQVGSNYEWCWMITNPNPGNGDNGTLQNISHWSVPLSLAAEAALVSAEYSFDGITWYSVSIQMERDPAIRACTRVDVLKFDAGTTGSDPTYYRVTFNSDFGFDPYSTSYIKSGANYGSGTKCNMHMFAGVNSNTTGN
jgi:hypothetical protein